MAKTPPSREVPKGANPSQHVKQPALNTQLRIKRDGLHPPFSTLKRND